MLEITEPGQARGQGHIPPRGTRQGWTGLACSAGLESGRGASGEKRWQVGREGSPSQPRNTSQDRQKGELAYMAVWTASSLPPRRVWTWWAMRTLSKLLTCPFNDIRNSGEVDLDRRMQNVVFSR